MAQAALYLFSVVAIAVIVGLNGQGSPRCPVNTVFDACPELESCRPSCKQGEGAEVCLDICDDPDCVCQSGYLLNSNGTCVLPKECPNGAPECPANKVWADCAKPKECRVSCSKPNGAEVCTTVCVQGCVCKDGLVLDDATGECIEKSKCCPENSTYADCPLLKTCRPTCEKPNGATDCTKQCDLKNQCVCNSGYVLNSEEACVLKSSCQG